MHEIAREKLRNGASHEDLDEQEYECFMMYADGEEIAAAVAAASGNDDEELQPVSFETCEIAREKMRNGARLDDLTRQGYESFVSYHDWQSAASCPPASGGWKLWPSFSAAEAETQAAIRCAVGEDRIHSFAFL